VRSFASQGASAAKLPAASQQTLTAAQRNSRARERIALLVLRLRTTCATANLLFELPAYRQILVLPGQKHFIDQGLSFFKEFLQDFEAPYSI
jgi:hypothetical protein